MNQLIVAEVDIILIFTSNLLSSSVRKEEAIDDYTKAIEINPRLLNLNIREVDNVFNIARKFIRGFGKKR